GEQIARLAVVPLLDWRADPDASFRHVRTQAAPCQISASGVEFAGPDLDPSTESISTGDRREMMAFDPRAVRSLPRLPDTACRTFSRLMSSWRAAAHSAGSKQSETSAGGAKPEI